YNDKEIPHRSYSLSFGYKFSFLLRLKSNRKIAIALKIMIRFSATLADQGHNQEHHHVLSPGHQT
ncbi:hypothetical protein, partial [Gluconobacter sp.]|uniref:hypothetical protein n=1 Tax=Gluconobacter sp. TaxID=1876758 RepID=UPI0039EC93EE